MNLHESSRFSFKDDYFVSGGNPDGSGGGIIGTAPTRIGAIALQVDAVKCGYTKVRVLTYKEISE